jgi:hypothetical protein
MTSSDPSSIPDKFNHIWPTGMSEEDICIFIYYFFHLKKKTQIHERLTTKACITLLVMHAIVFNQSSFLGKIFFIPNVKFCPTVAQPS